jgi:hypothetical protein
MSSNFEPYDNEVKIIINEEDFETHSPKSRSELIGIIVCEMKKVGVCPIRKTVVLELVKTIEEKALLLLNIDLISNNNSDHDNSEVWNILNSNSYEKSIKISICGERLKLNLVFGKTVSNICLKIQNNENINTIDNECSCSDHNSQMINLLGN